MRFFYYFEKGRPAKSKNRCIVTIIAHLIVSLEIHGLIVLSRFVRKIVITTVFFINTILLYDPK